MTSPHFPGQQLESREVMDAMKDVFSDLICPVCDAHLSKKSLLCLNACHLGERGKERFIKTMEQVMKKDG